MKFDNIDEIRDHEWSGNPFKDAPAFAALEEFAEDLTNSMADRVEAHRMAATVLEMFMESTRKKPIERKPE